MSSFYGDWKKFFEILPELKFKIEPLAKRSGISTDSALYLVLLADFSDKDLIIPDSLREILISRSLAEYTECGLKLTGKGAILAKSFIQYLEK